MTLSNRNRGDRCGRLPDAVVADEGIEHGDGAPCQADRCLDRAHTFGTIALIVGPRDGSRRAAISADMYITRRRRLL